MTGRSEGTAMISREEYSKPHKCPVCGQYEFPTHGSFDFCEVCGWQDDAVQEEDEEFGGANPEGLKWYRILYEHGKHELPLKEKYRWLVQNNLDDGRLAKADWIWKD